jgi:hypothetical protein
MSWLLLALFSFCMGLSMYEWLLEIESKHIYPTIYTTPMPSSFSSPMFKLLVIIGNVGLIGAPIAGLTYGFLGAWGFLLIWAISANVIGNVLVRKHGQLDSHRSHALG